MMGPSRVKIRATHWGINIKKKALVRLRESPSFHARIVLGERRGAGRDRGRGAGGERAFRFHRSHAANAQTSRKRRTGSAGRRTGGLFSLMTGETEG